jgi:hypothetical protein
MCNDDRSWSVAHDWFATWREPRRPTALDDLMRLERERIDRVISARLSCIASDIERRAELIGGPAHAAMLSIAEAVRGANG